MNDFESVESSLKNHLPEGEYEQVRRILYGKDCKGIRSQNILGLCGEKLLKGIPDSSHFIFEINVGKGRIRHKTTLNLNDAIFNRL